MVNTAKSIKLLLKCGTRTRPDRTFVKLERVIGTKASIGSVPFCRHRHEVSGKHEMQNARNRIERKELDCMNWIEIAWHQMNEWMNEWMKEWMKEWKNERMKEWKNERMKWSDMNRHEITWNKRKWNEWMSEWVNELMNQWTNEWIITLSQCFPILLYFNCLQYWFADVRFYWSTACQESWLNNEVPQQQSSLSRHWPAALCAERSAALSCLSSYFASLLYASSWATYYD